MWRSTVALLIAIPMLLPAELAGQRPELGIAIGRGLVGAADSRTIVGIGPDVSTTGASRPGWHLRAHAAWLVAPKLAFRAEVFVNWLSSGANTLVLVQGTGLRPATSDRTLGVLGTFTVAPFMIGALTPHFLVGVGAFESELALSIAGEPDEPPVELRGGGLGLGIQTGVGLQIPFVIGSLWLEWRYAQALNPRRGAGFMPLTVGLSF